MKSAKKHIIISTVPVSYTHLAFRAAFTSAPKVSKPGQSSTFAI